MKKFISSRFRIKSNDILFEGGNRLQKKKKKIIKGFPVITIITVVKNNEKYLEETIKSVLNQKYKNLEYIIIDGASTDGTLKTVEHYSNSLAKVVSEPDEGIYDAMNKGLKFAISF